MDGAKPIAEVLVEGELSPFEHEALYKILRKRFQIEQPSYTALEDEDLVTRINLTFHHPYTRQFFADILQEDWQDLKDLFKRVRYRRGRAGAAFTLTFQGEKIRLVFRSGVLEERGLASAMEQIAYLTSIIGQMVRPETMEKPLGVIETVYDGNTDRWHEFRGYSSSDQNERFNFDESVFRWVADR